MAFGVALILGCSEHLLPGQDPNSWQCRLADFRQSPTGHYVGLGVQFLLYFGCLMFLHWGFTSWRRWKKKNAGSTPSNSLV